MKTLCRFAIVYLLSLLSLSARAEDALVEGWNNPPLPARLRAYWWWLNGNVTRDAITKDLEWMKRVGMGGGLDSNRKAMPLLIQFHRAFFFWLAVFGARE